MNVMKCSYIGLLGLLYTGLGGCKKAFLEDKPSSAVIVPETLSDCQHLLENTTAIGGTPSLGEVSADNFYLSFDTWQALNSRERNAYAWTPDIFQGQGKVPDWNELYQQIFYANEVLECLQKIPVTALNEESWRNAQGAALFIRAYAFFHIAQVFAPVYDSSTAATDLGIPLRLQSDVSLPSVRASVAATYEQISSDLRQARSLLPATVSGQNPNRPSQPAAMAMLSRVYLSMRAYGLAGRYADSALQLYGSLLDYGTIDKKPLFPFDAVNNPEVIYQSHIVYYTQCLAAAAYPGTVIDSSLCGSYADPDMRKWLFFRINSKGLPNMKGSYADIVYPFTGLATDELYLTRAECAARQQRTGAALDDLNTLLQHRFSSGSFVPVTAGSWQEALDIILAERRKELPFRGTRWTDLRRLNKEGRNIILTRRLNGQLYQLLPNSKLYTLPIPPDVLQFNPSMIQNDRS